MKRPHGQSFWSGILLPPVGQKNILWPESATPVVRYAIGGDRIEHILWRVHHLDWTVSRPGKIILFAGANNVTSGPTPEAISQGIQFLVQQIQEKNPESAITVMAIPLRGADFTYKREFIEKTNRLTEEACEKYSYSFLDTNAAILRASGGRNPSFLFDDEVHYSEKGYTFIAGIVDQMVNA